MKLILNGCLLVTLVSLMCVTVPKHALAQGAYDSATFNRAQTTLEVLRITPYGKDVPAHNRQIVIKFNQPVVPLGDMQRDANDIPIDIQPKINCEWLWLDTSSLSCQLERAEQLAQATEYRLTVRPGISTVEGAEMDAEFKHSFITQRPKLENVGLFNWLREHKPIASVRFNQPVTKSSLEKSLQFKSSDGQVIAALAERDSNPLVDFHYRQAEANSEFIRLDHIIVGTTEESKAAAYDLAERERGGAHDEARTVWNISPATDLPVDTSIGIQVIPGLVSIFGDQAGIEHTIKHRFQSLPKFTFLGVNCSVLGKSERVTIKPSYAATDILRDEDGVKLQAAIEECDPLNNVALMFSAPVSYATAEKALTITPDLAGGIEDYNPWTTRHDSYYLGYFFDRRFNYGDNDPYQMALPEALKAYDGYGITSNELLLDELQRPLETPIDMGFLTSHRAPRLHYRHRHSVLEKGMQTELPVTITNLNSIKVVDYVGTTANKTFNKDEFDSPLADVEDIAYAVPLGIRKILDDQSGIVVGTLASDPLPPHYRQDAYHIVSQITPFQVHLKFGHFNSYVWVTDMATGQPVNGASVRLEIDNYFSIDPFGDQLSSVKTDDHGVAILPGVNTIDPKLTYLNRYRLTQDRIMLKVAKDDDLAVLPLDNNYRSWSSVRQRVVSENSYLHAWGTTAQGVYKAGDTIQYKIWVRNQDNENWVSPDKTGYTLNIIDPKGQRVKQIKELALSEFGSFDGELTTSESASVGWYRFELIYHANGQAHHLAPMQVLVSDFTPSPFRVRADLNSDQFQVGDTVSVTTLAQLHAGGPYADADARVTVQLNRKGFTSSHPEAKGFNFNDLSQGGSQTIHQDNSTVDKSGELLTEFTLNDAGFYFGRINVESAVRDDRGKLVAAVSSADYLGRDRFIGLRNTKWTHQVGNKAVIEHLVVDPKGEPIKDVEVKLSIQHYVTRAARVKGAGNAYLTQYSSEWEEVAECTQVSRLRRVDCVFTPKKPGSYKIRATIKDSKGRENNSELHTWVIGEGAVLWAGANNSAIEIIADEPSYKIGDVAKFLVKNPYPGAEALITVERYGVKRHWRQTFANSTEIIEVPIEDNDYPGIYLSVVVTSPRVAQPLGEGNVDLGKPAFKIGYVEVPVKDIKKEIEVSLKTNKKVYKPREQVKVKLKAKPRSGASEAMEVAVVVIDEAVFDLNLKGKSYYDPYKGFNKLDSLGVANYNLLMRLIGRQKFEKKGANPGGGGGGDDGASLRNIMKFVAYWNPSVELDKNGKTEFDFELPDNLTGWRVFAMAVTKEEKMGLGDINFKVNRPTELRPVMPNQLTEGDSVQAGFSVMNRTKKARTLTVELKAAGSALSVPVTEKVKVKLEPFERKRIWMPLKVEGAGELAFLATAGDAIDKDAVEHHVPVAKRRSLITAATYGTTTQEQVSEQFAYPQGIFQDVGGLSVKLSPSVIANVTGAFQYLRDYPYACWEQRLSKGLAASQYVSLKAYLPDEFEWSQSASLPDQTLASASKFQAPNGGMSYWINNNQYVSPYLSAYTALGFSWLRDQGYQIPVEVEDKLHDYLKRYLRKDIQDDPSNRQSLRKAQASIRAVALAALAASNKLDKSELLRYEPHLADMDLFGKAHYLQAATALNLEEQKLVDFSKNILSYSVQSGGKFQFNEESFYGAFSMHTTPMRSNCAILTGLLGVSNESELGQSAIGDVPFKQVRAITQTRGGQAYWANTQENLYCMNALINFSKVYEDQAPNMQVSVASVTEKYATQNIGNAEFTDLRDAPITVSNSELPIEEGLAGKIQISKQGDGRLYYQMLMRFAKTEDNADRINAGIEVRREYSVQRDGKWQLIESPMQLAKGELVRVDIYASTPTARQFVVIDDPIPGGLEPVNRDLATASSIDAGHSPSPNSYWFEQQNWRPYGRYGWSFYHKELRHDSARFYSDYLPSGNYHLSYTAQAIAGGSFSVMPLKVEEMYDPDVYGLGLPATLEVEHAED